MGSSSASERCLRRCAVQIHRYFTLLTIMCMSWANKEMKWVWWYVMVWCAQDVVDFKTPGEARRCGRASRSDSAICLMHNNLSSGTVYYFSVVAYNASGSSEMSDIVHCHTLSESQSTLPSTPRYLVAWQPWAVPPRGYTGTCTPSPFLAGSYKGVHRLGQWVTRVVSLRHISTKRAI